MTLRKLQVGPLGRSPEGGRNWEGFSPDPVLSGIAVAQHVIGIQDAGVMATTKVIAQLLDPFFNILTSHVLAFHWQ